MATQKRSSMRSIREVPRLKYEPGRSHRQLGVATSTASLYVGRAAEAGFSWPLVNRRRDWTTRRSSRPGRRRGMSGPSPTGRRFTGSFSGIGDGAAAPVAGLRQRPSERLRVQLVLQAPQGVARPPGRGAASALRGGGGGGDVSGSTASTTSAAVGATGSRIKKILPVTRRYARPRAAGKRRCPPSDFSAVGESQLANMRCSAVRT